VLGSNLQSGEYANVINEPTGHCYQSADISAYFFDNNASGHLMELGTFSAAVASYAGGIFPTGGQGTGCTPGAEPSSVLGGGIVVPHLTSAGPIPSVASCTGLGTGGSCSLPANNGSADSFFRVQLIPSGLSIGSAGSPG